jgi:CubicO group peptidase (beta-lactamase class C family)
MQNLTRAALALFALSLAACATAPPTPPGAAAGLVLPPATSAESVGLSSARLAEIEKVTQQHIESGDLAGAVMLVARNGQVAWLRVVGDRVKATKQPMRADAIFRFYSMTKAVVNVAALILVEEGKLSIDDPVSKYLPQVAGMKVGIEKAGPDGKPTLELVAPQRPMTVLDLMRHTSGMIYGGRGDSLVNAAWRGSRVAFRDTPKSVQLGQLEKLPLRFSPGTRWEYGVSTDILGAVVEAASGETLGAFIERRITGPLGMVDTSFQVPAHKADRIAQPPKSPRFDPTTKPGWELGGAGLMSTMADYLRFITMLTNGGELEGKRILGRRSVDLMTSSHTGNLPGLPAGIGHGMGVSVRHGLGEEGKTGLVGEWGWAGNAGTLFFVDPQRRLVGLYLVQVNDEDRVRLRNQFREMVYQAVTR